MIASRYLAAASCCAALAACGGSDDESADDSAARTPAPAPRVALTDDDRAVWASGPSRSVVPVLLYRDLEPDDFARQMVLLDQAGYETITLDELIRFNRGQDVALPPRPLLLTFDGGRLDSWTGSDGILRRLGFNAVVFVDAGRVAKGDPDYLTWRELNAMQRSGRWDVQLQSGSGNHQIRYGSAPDAVGPFYAYRGSEEVLGGWRERVFSDVFEGEQLLTHHVRGYRPLAFAPPYGNYGQAGTNDRRIPRELLARLLDSFEVVFTQDRTPFASAGAREAVLGRMEITRDIPEEDLHALLLTAPR
jgi:hypothetical protein